MEVSYETFSFAIITIGVFNNLFSGTYNTLRVVNNIKANLKDHEVDVIDVTKRKIDDVSNYDHLIICYPIYAFNAPKPIIDFAKNIKKLEKETKAINIQIIGHKQ